MRKLIIILLVIATIQLYAEKQIELTPIVLPYDSLNIDEVYGYGATIIARSGNTIYHSTDDGASWEIALESDTKLNQLYSKDPHTVFAIGDSGFIYRTFDYGATWFDVSIDTDLELREMVAGDYSDYMIITPRTYTFRKSNQDNEYDYLENRSDVILDNIEYHKEKYYFSGRASYSGYREAGMDISVIYIPLFIFEDTTGLVEIELDYMEIWSDYNLGFYNVKPISLGDDLFFSFNNVFKQSRSSVLTKNPNKIITFPLEGEYGIEIPDDTFIYVKEKDSIVTYITRNGNFSKIYTRDLVSKSNNRPFEKYDLEIDVVNNVFMIQDDDYLIASDNSTIYRTKLVNIPTSIEIETDSNVSLNGDVIELKNGIEIVSAINYLGQGIDVEKVGLNAYRLENGLCFMTYMDYNGIFKTIKLMVAE